MKILISEKQLKYISTNKDVLSDLSEDEDPAAAAPTSGESSTGEKTGYPEVGKWESGVTRGAGNQVGNTKWSDTVGATLVRGKSNPLK